MKITGQKDFEQGLRRGSVSVPVLGMGEKYLKTTPLFLSAEDDKRFAWVS
jgi:hypothetical protein